MRARGVQKKCWRQLPQGRVPCSRSEATCAGDKGYTAAPRAKPHSLVASADWVSQPHATAS